MEGLSWRPRDREPETFRDPAPASGSQRAGRARPTPQRGAETQRCALLRPGLCTEPTHGLEEPGPRDRACSAAAGRSRTGKAGLSWNVQRLLHWPLGTQGTRGQDLRCSSSVTARGRAAAFLYTDRPSERTWDPMATLGARALRCGMAWPRRKANSRE